MESLLVLGHKLAERGHKVVVGSFSFRRPKVENVGNLYFLDLGDRQTKESMKFLEKKISRDAKNIKNPVLMMRKAGAFYGNFTNQLSAALEDHFALSNNLSSFDALVVGTIAFEPFEAFASKRNIPLVLSHPTIAFSPFLNRALFSPFHGTNIPLHGKSLPQRLFTASAHILADVADSFGLSPFSRQKKYLTLVQSAQGFDYPGEYPPLVQFTGPLLSKIRTEKSVLDTSLLSFLEADSRPVVYVSMGTVVHLSAEMVRKLLGALAEKRRGEAKTEENLWKVVWALPEDQWEGFSSTSFSSLNSTAEGIPILRDLNMYIAPWISTPAMLQLPQTVAFISHCGGNGAHEAMAFGKPIIGFPFFGDQPEVCKRIADRGAGVWGDLEMSSEDEIRQMVREVVVDRPTTYQSNAHYLQKVFSMAGGVEKAADWVEFVASVKGDVRFLETPNEREGPIKAHCLDVLFILLLLAVVGFWCLLRRVIKLSKTVFSATALKQKQL